ncbi:hypothetical protein DVH24_021186, partial [Malus domestica]
VGHFCQSALPHSTKVDTHWDFLVIKQWCCSFTLVDNSRVAGLSKFIMFGPSDLRFDLNFGEEAAMPSLDNIWRPSFLSPTGPLTIGDSVMKNDMTPAVVTRNLLTPKDNRLLSKRSDELAVKNSLALSVQCAGSVSNMPQRLFA